VVELLRADAVDETRASEREALWLRKRGEHYRAIGRALGCSGGQAHHKVRAAHERALEDAYDLLRPPGRDAEPSPERAAQLLDRLALDFRRVRRVTENHLDPSSDTATDVVARRRVARFEAAFAKGLGQLTARADALEAASSRAGKKRGADKGLCRRVERSFAGLFGVAAELDAVLREHVSEEFVRAVFGRDLAELAAILEIECTPAPPLPARFCLTESDELPEPPAVALDAEARWRRNERIVTARLGGASVGEVAAAEGLSRRQVRRIMAEHRSGRHLASPAALEVMDEAVYAIRRELAQIDEVTDDDDDDPATRIRLGAERIGLLGNYVSVLRNGGWLSPEGVAQARKDAPGIAALREEFASEANQRLRRLFGEVGVPDELAEAAYDEVIIAAGMGEWLPDADNVQA
jgi:hypothetical protein